MRESGEAAAGTQIARLPPLESAVLWAGWVFGCAYSTYRLHRVIARHPDALDVHASPGWVGPLSVDRCDDELEVLFKAQLPAYAVFMTMQLVVGRLLRGLALFKLVPLAHFLLSAGYLCFSVGWRRWALLLATALALYAGSRTRRRLVCWALVGGALLGHARLLAAALPGPDLTPEAESRSFVATVVQMWGLCRAVMFCCDQADRPAELAAHDNLPTYLGFVFYGPSLGGPLLSHQAYLASLAPADQTAPPLGPLLSSLARLAGWFLLLEVSNHVIHYHALVYVPDEVARLFGRWEVAGLNYWSGQYFHVKYVVLYGVPSALARFDGVEPPPAPRCVSWIASYSDMWKHFDPGLYRFMRRHIQARLVGAGRPSALRRWLASVAVFTFVFVWHGLLLHILVWAAANLACVTVERAAARLAATRPGRHWSSVVGPALRRRCHALLLSPLFLVSLVAQVGFLNNSWELGWLAMREGLAPATTLDLIVTLAFLYCGCQVSYDVKRWRQMRSRLPREADKLKRL